MRDLTVPKLLFLKCSTSGLYREDLPITDEGQPWCCEIAAMLCNEAGVRTQAFAHLIKADGRRSKTAATEVHGISDWALSQVGVPESRVIGLLGDMLKTTPPDAMKVITWGEMDPMIISSLFARFAVKQGKDASAYARLWAARARTERINLVSPWATAICKLPGGPDGSYKWPTLDEAAKIILGREPVDGHRDAWRDLETVRDLYFSMVASGVVEREAA